MEDSEPGAAAAAPASASAAAPNPFRAVPEPSFRCFLKMVEAHVQWEKAAKAEQGSLVEPMAMQAWPVWFRLIQQLPPADDTGRFVVLQTGRSPHAERFESMGAVLAMLVLCGPRNLLIGVADHTTEHWRVTAAAGDFLKRHQLASFWQCGMHAVQLGPSYARRLIEVRKEKDAAAYRDCHLLVVFGPFTRKQYTELVQPFLQRDRRKCCVVVNQEAPSNWPHALTPLAILSSFNCTIAECINEKAEKEEYAAHVARQQLAAAQSSAVDALATVMAQSSLKQP